MNVCECDICKRETAHRRFNELRKQRDGLQEIVFRVQALAAQWREDSQTYWADQLAQALDPNDLYPGLLTLDLPVGVPQEQAPTDE